MLKTYSRNLIMWDAGKAESVGEKSYNRKIDISTSLYLNNEKTYKKSSYQDVLKWWHMLASFLNIR